MQHALTIRLVALTIIILSVGVGAASYLGANGKAEDAAAQMHVRAAVAATTAWYQDPYGGHGSYRTLDSTALVRQAPAVSSKIEVTVLARGHAYCLADVENRGHSAYFLGGNAHALADLAGATAGQVTLLHSTSSDAAALCTSLR
jgi:hypothetical protein